MFDRLSTYAPQALAVLRIVVRAIFGLYRRRAPKSTPADPPEASTRAACFRQWHRWIRELAPWEMPVPVVESPILDDDVAGLVLADHDALTPSHLRGIARRVDNVHDAPIVQGEAAG